MPEAVLQEYSQEIRRLIDESHLGEAVRHCRHILGQFPRHVETYRLMGKALLEQGELESAADVFQRVLSADPEDFIAHAGMAIIYKESDRLREAAWHMERAFEVDPYNGAIRDALQDIVGRRDGLPPEQLTLTRGALARLYLKGELYSQAIGDLKQLLDEDPDRVDLEILLAEALWRDGQRVEAAEVCSRVLERLPDCVKANAILAEVSLVTDRVDEAQNYLRRVFELVLPSATSLDIGSAVGRAFSTDGSPALPETILVNRAVAEVVADTPADAADWVQDLDFGEEFALEHVEPEWLGALQNDSDVLAGEEDDSNVDWVRGVAVHGPEDEAPAETEGEVTAEATSWFSQSSDQLPGIGELREETDWESWLGNKRETEAPVEPGSRGDSFDGEEVRMGTIDDPDKNQEEFPEAEEPKWSDEGRSGKEGEGFDWLDELQEASEPTQPGELEGMDDDALPDWLRDGIVMDEMAEVDLDWLGDSEEDEASEAMNPPAGDGSDLPDWLREEMAAAGSDEPTTSGDDLSWLDQIAAGEGPPIEEPPTMSWPESELSEPIDPEAQTTNFEAEDDVPEDLDEAMAWLEQLASQQGAPLEELPSLAGLSDRDEENVLSEVPEDVTDAMAWLDELAEEQTPDLVSEPAPMSIDDMAEAEEEADDGELHWLDELARAESEPDFDLESIGEAAESDELPDVADGDDWFDEVDEKSFDAAALTDDKDMFEIQAGIGREELALESEPAAEQPAATEEDDEPLDDLNWLDDVDDDSEIDGTHEVDEAMAWLEELAAEGGSDAELRAWEGFSNEEAGLEAMAGLEDIPDDPEQALAWLEGLAAETGEPQGVIEVVEEEATPAVPHDVVAARAEAEAILLHDEQYTAEVPQDAEILEEMPEDPDEAMVWLEKLAARQGASLDELPSVTGIDEEIETPDWLAAELAAEEEEFAAERIEEVEDFDLLFDEDTGDEDEWDEPDLMVTEQESETREAEMALDATEVSETEPVDADLEAALLSEMEAAGVDVEEDLPDWLALDDEDADVQFDWDEPAFDPTGWLQAEESAVQDHAAELEAEEDQVVDAEHGEIELEEFEDVTEGPVLAPEASAQELDEVTDFELDEDVLSETEEADGLVSPETFEEPVSPIREPVEREKAAQFPEAWNALESERYSQAYEMYGSYLERGDDISLLISDLERATEAHESQPRLVRLLGDAYMQNGQLQKALDAYRKALEML